MPPIIAATCWPFSNSPPGATATTPVASMPSTRGKVTPFARPRRVCSSERLIPNAWTWMSTQPGRGSGTASLPIRSAAGGPGASSTTARMVAVMPRRNLLELRRVPRRDTRLRDSSQDAAIHGGTRARDGRPGEGLARPDDLETRRDAEADPGGSEGRRLSSPRRPAGPPRPAGHPAQLMSISPDPSRPLLPDEVSEEIGKQLQLTLVELIALSLAGKQLHWSVYGREFLTVHRHLDQLVEQWRELEDLVAERAAAIGLALDGSAAAVIELCDLRPLEPGFSEIERAVELLCAQLSEVAARVRRRARLVDALDVVSHEVLVDVVRRIEEQVWTMRAQLPDELSG